MCSICDKDNKTLVLDYRSAQLGVATMHIVKADPTAMTTDGVGDKFPKDLAIALPTAVVDTIPGDTSTTATLTVGGAHIVSTINTPGDFDFFKVNLTAGVTYEFGQYQVKNGPSMIPLADALIEIYDAQGTLLTSADGGGPFTPSGLDALLTFTAATTGTYYINARAFDQDATDGTRGEVVGDYEVFARTSDYKPYYDLNSPLHSLDWGSQFDGTSRNPDGDRGTRPDGLEVENKIGGKNVLYVYFARAGDVFVSEAADPTHLTATMVAKGLQPWEKDSFNAVFDEYEKVADLVYVETDNRYAADITVITYNGTPGPGVSLLGRMSPPDEYNEGQTEYNAGDERWTQAGLAPGGFYFGTLIHEFGHGHGMAHPHDNGGKSSVMRGVAEDGVVATYTLGDFDLNQGVYTMMSYQDGWQKSPYGQAADDAGYGYIGSLMAFDIAVIQDKYGVNEDWAKGNDTYTLKDVNAAGTFYSSIWDGGGTDQIVYSGTRDTNIDLRPATLKYEVGGGGFISYAYGIYGGFTVANGVTIENATSGGGNDTLTGNDVANSLNSGAGNDTLIGNGGDDMLDGGTGIDTMKGGTGNDIYFVDTGDAITELANEGFDYAYATGTYVLTAGAQVEVLATRNYQLTTALNLTGNEFNNAITGNDGANTLRGRAGDDTLYGLEGNDLLDGGAGADWMMGGAGNDIYYVDSQDRMTEAVGGGFDYVYASASYAITAGAEVENLATINYLLTTALDLTGNEFNNAITGNNGANVLQGLAGDDTLSGQDGTDTLDGGAGQDFLTGGGGADTFRFTAAGDSAGAGDIITDFVSGTDKIDLTLIDADGATAGDQAFTSIGNAAFSNQAGQLRFEVMGGQTHIYGDTNGDGTADLHIVANTATIVPTDFVF